MPEAFKCNNVPSYVRFSLKTKNLQTALRSARRIAVKFDALANQYFETEEAFAYAIRLLEDENEIIRNSHSLEDYELKSKIDSTGGLNRDEQALLDKLFKYFNAKKLTEGSGTNFSDETSQFEEAINQLSIKIDNQHISNLTPKLLSEAIVAFTSQKSLKWGKDTGSKQKYDAIFKLFLDITGNIKTTELTKEHSNQFKALILNYPANKNKDKKYRHLSTKDLLTAYVSDEDKLKNRTKSFYLGHVSTFLDFISSSGWALPDINRPLIGVVPKKSQLTVNDRDLYTDQDLTKLFNSKAYTECKHKEAFKYWAPLIGLLSGARQNEICQLFVTDIIFNEETNTWLFYINENDSTSTFKSLKREHHERKVPIHKILINLGFLDYVEYLKKKGEKRLFPELPYNGGRNKYATRMTKWFNSTYTNKVNCNITTPNTCFHSLRHNVINYFAHKLNLNSSRFAYVIGQTPVGNVSDTTYIKAADIIQFSEWYAKLDFSYCIDFKKIPNWKRFPFARNI